MSAPFPATMKIVYLPDGTKEYVPDWDEVGQHDSPIETEMHRLLRGAFGHNVEVIPQCEIGPYRVDFSIRIERDTGMSVVVVECDGRQFHQDIVKDAQRERELRKWGVNHIVRATGSEIFLKPQETLGRVLSVVSAYGGDLTRDHWTLEGPK